MVQVGQTLYKAALEVPSTSSCSVLIVDGSSFGGSKLGNGSHGSMEQPAACVVPSETLPFSDFRCKLLNLYDCPSTTVCYQQKMPTVQA